MNNNVITLIRRNSLFLAWAVACVAMLGSLYFSEIAGFIPCELCWYQRIFMYPLVILLGIANFRRDHAIAVYCLPLSFVGGAISLLHYLIQKVDAFSQVSPCSDGVPCSGEYINWLGFMTIPLLALIAFTMISALLWVGRKQH